MEIAYVRCSCEDQNDERQILALENYNIEKWFIEKVSGKNITDRKELKAMLDFCREGDTIHIMDFSRLARSTKDLLDIVDSLGAKNVHLHSIKEGFDTSTPHGRLMLTMLAAIYEFERVNILERQMEGIAIAKAKGVYKGRKKKEYDKEKFEYFYALYMHRGKYEGKLVTVSLMSQQLGISRPTVYRLISQKEEGGEKDERKE